MAYRKFKIAQLESEYGITVQRLAWLDTTQITPIEPTEILKIILKKADLAPLSTEKAVSERLISPILTEILERNIEYIQLFSGESINADESKGLNGEIDFLFNLRPYATDPDSPVFAVTEAKIGLLQKAWAQAAAQLIGISVFNMKHSNPLNVLYSAVSDGTNWQFLKYEGKSIFIHNQTFTLSELPLILGIFQYFVDKSKK